MQLSVLIFEDQQAVVDALQVLFEVHRIPVMAAETQDEVLLKVAAGGVGVYHRGAVAREGDVGHDQ